MTDPTAEDARRIVERVLGIAPVVIDRFATGAHHYVYDVKLADGRKVVARIAKPSERYAIEGAVRLSGQLRPLGVPLPELLASELDDVFPWMLLQRLAGRDLVAASATLTDDQLRDIARHVAAAQAATATTPTAGRYGYAIDPAAAPHSRWSGVLEANLERSHHRIAHAGLFDPQLVLMVERRLASFQDRLDAIPATPFLHDTTTKNVIVADDGSFSGIVDVDDLCFGDPRYPAALTLAAVTAYGGSARYVSYWLDAAGQAEDEPFRFYVALFLLDLMAEHGQVFNGNERPLSAEVKQRLEQAFAEATQT